MRFLSLLFIFLVGCCQTPIINPSPKPDAGSLCAQMCQHIGPKEKGGLGCEEGNPVYDSDKPGPKDVPNETCEEFCNDKVKNKIDMNPKCLVKVPSCDKIEEYRAKNSNEC
jgi:hypothetical protein